jgi:tRNA (guanine-N7-)-methyltransferase
MDDAVAAPPDERTHRPIRSYVLRQSRVSPAQERALQTLLPIFGVPFVTAPVDWPAVFGRTSDRILEIGSGMGETTADIAEAQPDKDFIAVEVHRPGIGSLLRHIDERRLTNLRVVPHDATEVVTHMIGTETLAGIHVFFPDPWPKKRHHKRRLLQPAFVRLLADRLAPEGYLHAATDWLAYAEEMLTVLEAEALLQNTVADGSGFAPRPTYRPLTKFERRGLNLGHEVNDLVFRKPSGSGAAVID